MGVARQAENKGECECVNRVGSVVDPRYLLRLTYCEHHYALTDNLMCYSSFSYSCHVRVLKGSYNFAPVQPSVHPSAHLSIQRVRAIAP